MSAAREAIYLPFLFLTVTLLGGFRLGGGLTPLMMIPPSLFSLVLAVLLIGVLIKSGALLPEQLMNASFNSLQLVNTYGMFGSITPARDEVIVNVVDRRQIGFARQADGWFAHDVGEFRLAKRRCQSGLFPRM
jgi:phosphoglycerol transferase MdoB-like AlkP superfamily enzyme